MNIDNKGRESIFTGENDGEKVACAEKKDVRGEIVMEMLQRACFHLTNSEYCAGSPGARYSLYQIVFSRSGS